MNILPAPDGENALPETGNHHSPSRSELSLVFYIKGPHFPGKISHFPLLVVIQMVTISFRMGVLSSIDVCGVPDG